MRLLSLHHHYIPILWSHEIAGRFVTLPRMFHDILYFVGATTSTPKRSIKSIGFMCYFSLHHIIYP
jgi:hypothetical protein